MSVPSSASASSTSQSPYLRPSSSSLLSMSSHSMDHSSSSHAPRAPSPSPAASSSSSTVYTGRIASINVEKGFAWIRCRSLPSPVFVHQSNVVGHQVLSERDKVQFTIGPNVKDPTQDQALNVEIIAFANPDTQGQKWEWHHKRKPVKAGGGGVLSVPSSPAAHGNAMSTAEYFVSLPHYGEVTAVHVSGDHRLLTIVPLLPTDRVEDFTVNITGQSSGFKPGSLVTYHQSINSSSLTDLIHLPPSSLTRFPLHLTNLANTFTTHLLLRRPIHVDEDRYTEFKSLLLNHHTEDRVAFLVEKNVCAFLNSEGGWLYIGVDDSGVVEGLWLDKKRRDELKRRVDSVMQHMTPPVDTQLYKLDLLPVYVGGVESGEDGVVGALQLPDVYVLVLKVERVDRVDRPIYFTSGRLKDSAESASEQKAWLRRDGSVRAMTSAQVNERNRAIHHALIAAQQTKAEQDKVEEERKQKQMREDTINEALLKFRQQQEEEKKEEQGSQQMKEVIVNCLLDMGVERGEARQVVEEVAKEGRLKRKGDNDTPRVINEILDRISKTQKTDDKGQSKDEKKERWGTVESPVPMVSSAPMSPPLMSSAPPSSSSSLYPALHSMPSSSFTTLPLSSPSLPPPSSLSTSSSSMYPTVAVSFRPTSPMVQEKGGAVSVRASEKEAGQVVEGDGSTGFPCEFCPCSFTVDYLMEHQRRCQAKQRMTRALNTEATPAPSTNAVAMEDLTNT